jgi:hypothetical protein
LFRLLVLLLLPSTALADETVYGDALEVGWDSWSWDCECDFAATSDVHAGTAAIHAETVAWGAVSLHRAEGFRGATELRFWILGNPWTLQLKLHGPDDAEYAIALDGFLNGPPNDWMEVVFDLRPHAGVDWNRFSVMDGTGGTNEFTLDDIQLLGGWPAGMRAAEPVGDRRIMVLGEGAYGAVNVTLDGTPVEVAAVTTATSPSRGYLELEEPLDGTVLVVETPDGTFERTLRSASATLGDVSTHTIPDAIYGVNLASDPDDLNRLGAGLSRWGGNHTSRYNPTIDATNLAKDWFFENEGIENAGSWVVAVDVHGRDSILSIPALDWVAKDEESYSFPVYLYGDQQANDPYREDVGNGIDLAGELITADPTTCCSPWSDSPRAGDPDGSAYASEWLEALPTAPTYLAIDNELDIAGQTHRDVHPDPMSYDELWERWSRTAATARLSAPAAELLGPSSCCWWYFWNSDEGAADKAAHSDQDFLPWFLNQAATLEADTGARLLDALDIHYYPEGVFLGGEDEATTGHRLRASRSLWDPTYTDESWIGTSADATVTQPSPNNVMLIPRMKALIDAHYPGTKLAITEWNFGAERTVAGGLAVADVLGIFGREGVDVAAYWDTPPVASPAESGFRLFRDGAGFASGSLPVTADSPDDHSVFASRSGARTTVVIVNKADTDLLLDTAGLPVGPSAVKRFGGGLIGLVLDDPTLEASSVLVVPALGAALYSFDDPTSDDDDATADDDDATEPNDDDATEPNDDDATPEPTPPGTLPVTDSCGCHAAPRSRVLGFLPLALLFLRRRVPRA